MAADIIEFPLRGHEDHLVSAIIRLEEIVRETERIAVDQPLDGLQCLLTVMEHLAERLVETSTHLLDADANGRLQDAFALLSEKIAEARELLSKLGKPVE